MKKQFELSAYGVEEINQKELVEVEGGAFVACILIGLVLALAALVVTGGGDVYFNGTRVVDTGRVNEDGYPIYTADALGLLDL